ncbi:MAG: CZB domain-containing protein [Pseudomonadales bacterium]|nr:CZB domain-containing protein [Pseudomonadales bacterium]
MQNTARKTVEIPNGIFSDTGVVDALTFKMNDTHYAVPISQVRYIEQITTHTRRIDTTSGPREVTDYQGNPVIVVDFANFTHSQSQHRENFELIKTLKQREQDHIDWLDALEDSVQNGTAFTKATDPHLCAFGKWYDTFKPKDELLSDIMADFDAPHRHIHSLAETLLKLVGEDEKQRALDILEKERNTTLTKLRNLFAVARDRLTSITRPVFVFVQARKNQMIAIRLDAIDDIILFNQKHYAPYDSMQGVLGHDLDFFAGYLSEDGDTHRPYILLDWRLFEL